MLGSAFGFGLSVSARRLRPSGFGHPELPHRAGAGRAGL